MADEFLPESVRQFITEAAKWAESMPRVEPLPVEVIETAQALQPYIDSIRATIEQMAVVNSPAGILARQQDTFAKITASFAATQRLPIPTPDDLTKTEADLRARVVPEASEQGLQQAITEILDESEKLKLAAFLTDVLKRAASTSPTPWLVFVLVFWVAMKMNPDEVGALALAYAVMCNVNSDS